MSEKTKKNNEKLFLQGALIIIVAAVVVFFSARIIGKCYNPFVFNDEAGYWTHASAMVGYDWRGMSNGLAWYSFGYSFMLVPLMKIIHDPVTLYRAALVLNVIMQLLVYFMYIRILRFLFPKLGMAVSVMISGASAMYTAYQHNTGIAFSETALLFVTVLITYVLVAVIEAPSAMNLGILGLFCSYIFMVHNRCIGIVASACLVVVICVLTGRIRLKTSFAFFTSLVSGLVVYFAIRHFLEAYLWVSGKATGNDSGSMADKIKRALTNRALFIKMLSVCASQLFAAVVSTFGVALFALKGMTARIADEISYTIKSLKKEKKERTLTDGKNLIFLFIFCAFISTWLISSVFMLDLQRIDHAVYTRYYDIMIGLLVMTGLCFMTEEDRKSDNIFFMLLPAVLILGANRAFVLVRNIPGAVFSRVCAPGICWYYDTLGTDFYKYALYASASFGILLFFSRIRKHNAGVCISSVLLAAAFTVSANYARTDLLINQDAYKGDRELVQHALEIPDAELRVKEETGTFNSFLQFMMQDRKISFLTPEDEQNENVYFFAEIKDSMNLRDYEVIEASDRHVLYRCHVVPEPSYEIPLSFMSMFDESQYISETDDIQSTSTSNYVCYGPYFKVDKGEYDIVLDMDFETTDIENIGYAEIKSSTLGAVYDHVNLTGDMVEKDGSLKTELSLDIEGDVPDMEIIVFIYNPERISMVLNSITVNTEE